MSEIAIYIPDSYKIRKKSDMIRTLQEIKGEVNSDVFKRPIKSLIFEWRGHNLLYDLGILRTHTDSVDLEYPQKWYLKIIWRVLSMLYIGR